MDIETIQSYEGMKVAAVGLLALCGSLLTMWKMSQNKIDRLIDEKIKDLQVQVTELKAEVANLKHENTLLKEKIK